MDEFDLPIMDRARARAAGEDAAPARPGPIAGPRRGLPFSNTTLAIACAVLAALLFVMMRGLPQPLAPLALAETPTAETATHPSIQPTLPPASGPGRIAAWWSPGGEAVEGGLLADSISGPIALCLTRDGLVQVAIGGQPGPWVEAEAAGVPEELLAVLPNAGGVCNPPTPTARPYVAPAPVAAPAPPPVVVWATDTVPAVPLEGRERPTGEPPPPAATNCPLVLTGGCKGDFVTVQP